MSAPFMETHITSLPKVASGKVRDIYRVGDDKLLIIATDRISAFDSILPNAFPGKGKILTGISNWWFEKLADIVPNHHTHIAPESVVSPEEVDQVRGRAVVVKALKPIPVEAVIRGYLVGSAWSAYKTTGIVGSKLLPTGLAQAQALPAPIFTPTTKAPVGEHDEPISFSQIEQRIGPAMADQIRQISLELYIKAAEIAKEKGLLLADTKFEFGWDENNQLTLMDEILTPDSSRFWPVEYYRPGINPPSLDKQYLRDYLEGSGWDKEGTPPPLPPEILNGLQKRYQEAYHLIIGHPLEQ